MTLNALDNVLRISVEVFLHDASGVRMFVEMLNQLKTSVTLDLICNLRIPDYSPFGGVWIRGPKEHWDPSASKSKERETAAKWMCAARGRSGTISSLPRQSRHNERL